MSAGLLLVAWAVLVAPPVAAWLEGTLVTHVLVQLPLLAGLGYYAGRRLTAGAGPGLQRGLAIWNAGGIPGVVLASATGAFWMIPLALDAAVASPVWAWAKYLSVTLCLGAALGASWGALHFIARGVIWIEFIATLLRLGWIALAFPARLCVQYRYDEQLTLGAAQIVLAVLVSAWWVWRLFAGESARANPGRAPATRGMGA